MALVGILWHVSNEGPLGTLQPNDDVDVFPDQILVANSSTNGIVHMGAHHDEAPSINKSDAEIMEVRKNEIFSETTPPRMLAEEQDGFRRVRSSYARS
jgi:hypothetical protein